MNSKEPVAKEKNIYDCEKNVVVKESDNKQLRSVKD